VFGVSTWLSCFSIMVVAQVAWVPGSRGWPAWRPRSPSPIRCTRRSRVP
jgi:hypothetical protein